MWVFDIKHFRLRSSVYEHMEAKTNWGTNKASNRPQYKGSVQFPSYHLRCQVVSWSGSYLVSQPLLLGDSLWHLSWLWRLILSNTTTCFSVDRTCFLFLRSRAMPACASSQAFKLSLILCRCAYHHTHFWLRCDNKLCPASLTQSQLDCVE